MVFSILPKSQKIINWATFQRKFCLEIFQKSPNLVTLYGNTHTHPKEVISGLTFERVKHPISFPQLYLIQFSPFTVLLFNNLPNWTELFSPPLLQPKFQSLLNVISVGLFYNVWVIPTSFILFVSNKQQHVYYKYPSRIRTQDLWLKFSFLNRKNRTPHLGNKLDFIVVRWLHSTLTTCRCQSDVSYVTYT